jgi:prepilin-type N-terminal cleavage/methylation domain-containing protein
MKKGFTLIEFLVAMGIFSLISGSVAGFFVSSLRAQRKALASQELLDNTSFLLEYIGRALRMAKKDKTGSCLGGAFSGYNFINVGSDSAIRFLNSGSICQQFEYNIVKKQLYEKVSSNESYLNFDSARPLSPSDFQINSIQFKLYGEKQSETPMLQPKVKIFLEIETKAPNPAFRSKIRIQTTISQRNLDVVY